MTDTLTPVYENIYYHKVKVNENKKPNNSLKQTQEQVDELVEILHENVGKAVEREQKLSDLKEISESLEKSAGEFKTQAVVVRRKEWRKRLKTKLVFAALILFLFLIVMLIIIHTLIMK